MSLGVLNPLNKNIAPQTKISPLGLIFFARFVSKNNGPKTSLSKLISHYLGHFLAQTSADISPPNQKFCYVPEYHLKHFFHFIISVFLS